MKRWLARASAEASLSGHKENNVDPKWLGWAKSLQAIAQNGLTYARNPFDSERYTAVRAVASEMMATHSGVEPAYVAGLFALEVGHATPKVAVRGVVFQGDALLLVKEPEDGLWSLPGGWADAGESPSAAVVREVLEESGYRTRAVKLLAVLDRDKQGHPPIPYHAYKLIFQCELLSERPERKAETEEAAFFREDQIPELSAARVTPAQIHRFFEHHRHADWASDFD